MPFPSKYVESLQRNDKLKKYVMVAIKGGLSGHGIPGGYFSDASAKAAVEEEKAKEKAGKPIKKAGKPIKKAGKPIKKAGKPHCQD